MASDRMEAAGRVMFLNSANVTEVVTCFGVYPGAKVGYQDLSADAARKDRDIVLRA
jgi:hypothetical protein